MKKILDKIIFVIVLCLLSETAFSQAAPRPLSGYYNLEKYWFYRYRLINDFMKIGPNCGESLPFAERVLHDWRRGKFDINTLYSGGEIPIHLGDYISALATEYRLLNNNSLNTGRTEYELNLALNAFERMDRYAEYYTKNMYDLDYYDTSTCPSSNESSLNGFFIRDDVPYTRFIPEHYKHLNRAGSILPLRTGIHKTETALDRYEKVYDPSISDYWYNPGWKHRCVPHEESKDGTINLAMGFALSSKLLGISPIGLRARGNLQRMVEYIYDGSRPGSPGSPHRLWTIVNPVTKECVYGDRDANNCDKGGGRYRECAQGAHITNDKWGFPRPIYVSPDLVLLSDLSQVWTVEDDLNFYGTYAALGDHWKIAGISSTWRAMKSFAKAKNESCPQLPYLYRVMNPGKGNIFMPIQTQIKLDAAPPCGTHNYYGEVSNYMDYSVTPPTYVLNPPYAWHWSGPNLVHSHYSRQEYYTPGALPILPRELYSEFNGLDYMVLFNLYSLQDIYLLWMFNSYYKENFNLNFPDKVGTPYETGSYHRQLKLNFLEYVSSINKINEGGFFTMRCGKAIELKPGFEAKKDCRFLAYIEDYHIDCGNRETHRPSEEYHYAEINQKPGWVFQPNSILGQVQSDTTYFLDFPPDGVPYTADSSVQTNSEDSFSCEQIQVYIDSLITEIYSSGEPETISFLDSILPFITIPECDSSTVSSLVGSNKSGMGEYTENQSGLPTQNALRTAFFGRILDKTNSGKNFNVYPNPNNGRFTVAFAEIGNYSVRIINSSGLCVFDTKVYSRRSETIYLDGLSPGVYTIEIVNPADPQHVKKTRTFVIHSN